MISGWVICLTVSRISTTLAPSARRSSSPYVETTVSSTAAPSRAKVNQPLSSARASVADSAPTPAPVSEVTSWTSSAAGPAWAITASSCGSARAAVRANRTRSSTVTSALRSSSSREATPIAPWATGISSCVSSRQRSRSARISSSCAARPTRVVSIRSSWAGSAPGGAGAAGVDVAAAITPAP